MTTAITKTIKKKSITGAAKLSVPRTEGTGGSKSIAAARGLTAARIMAAKAIAAKSFITAKKTV